MKKGTLWIIIILLFAWAWVATGVALFQGRQLKLKKHQFEKAWFILSWGCKGVDETERILFSVNPNVARAKEIWPYAKFRTVKITNLGRNENDSLFLQAEIQPSGIYLYTIMPNGEMALFRRSSNEDLTRMPWGYHPEL